MKIVRSPEGMKALAQRWRRLDRKIALVPTMGALHEGHLSLVRAARKSTGPAGRVVVSIFVNPLQFGPREDFRKYPRTLRRDVRLLTKAGVDALFYPSPGVLFPDGFCTAVRVMELSGVLCGKFRPGHFDGVATVVAKLFSIVSPDVAFFGQKDYQQCKIIQRMAQDLDLGVKVRRMPIVREKDGLAMSSRNRYLSASQRKLAANIFRVLRQARRAAGQGQRNAVALRSLALQDLKRAGIADVDYIEIVDGDTLKPLKKVRASALMAVAARIGSTRLIDNTFLAR